MTIEIQQPALQALIERHMATGCFENIEDLLLKTLDSSPKRQMQSGNESSLDEVFASVRGLFSDGELDFSRSLSPSRAVDLS